MNRRMRMQLWIVLACCVSACSDAPEVSPLTATLEGGTYRNHFFNLTLTIPGGWSVAGPDTQAYIREVRDDLVTGDDTTENVAMQASLDNTYDLLTVSEFSFGAPVDVNPTLMLIAERLNHAPGVVTGADYLFHARNAMQASELSPELLADTYPALFGAREWYRMDMRLHLPHTTAIQSFITLRHGDFALLFILVAETHAEMVSLERILETIVY